MKKYRQIGSSLHVATYYCPIPKLMDNMTEKEIAEKLALAELAKIKAPLPEPTVTKVTTKEERQLKRLEDCDRLVLSLPYDLADGLLRMAEFKKLTLEAYCLQLLSDSLNTKVGAAWISGPSNLGGVAVTKRVTGPSFSVTRGDS